MPSWPASRRCPAGRGSLAIGDFQLVLRRYLVERFLYRLGQSKHREHFVLKGAMLFVLWDASIDRPRRIPVEMVPSEAGGDILAPTVDRRAADRRLPAAHRPRSPGRAEGPRSTCAFERTGVSRCRDDARGCLIASEPDARSGAARRVARIRRPGAPGQPSAGTARRCSANGAPGRACGTRPRR